MAKEQSGILFQWIMAYGNAYQGRIQDLKLGVAQMDLETGVGWCMPCYKVKT